MPQFASRLNQDDGLKRVLRMIGIADADAMVVQPPAQGDPDAAQAQAAVMVKQMDIRAKQQENQRKAATEAVEAQQHERDSMRDAVNDAANRQSQERIAAIREETERLRLVAEEHRAARELSVEHVHHQQDAAMQQQTATQDRQERAEARQFGGNGL
jgi:hypothetical protein